MVKKHILSLFLVLSFVTFVSCDSGKDPVDPPFIEQDYVENLKLDMNSITKKCEVTVKTFIDGDTTHFNIDDQDFTGNVLKARYLAINTPESTGLIEEWGKAASVFTKTKLSSAYKIMLESNDSNWNHDSTGSRYLVFIWYKESAEGDWRNLNLEILQNGYAKPSNVLGNIYGETMRAALDQAKYLKLHVFSEGIDPDYYYGSAQMISLKTLRCNVESYNLQKVAFDGVVTRSYNNGVYVENLDEETGIYFGMYVYYGLSAVGEVANTLQIGKYVRVVGTVSEFNGSYQVSGLEYNEDDENTTKILEDETLNGFSTRLSQGNVYFLQPYTTITGADFATRNETLEFVTEVEGQEQTTTKNYRYAQLIMNTTVSMTNLQVTSVYTTESDNDNSDGALTLTCTVDNKTVKIRTVVLKDAGGNVIQASTYNNKNINVKGIIDCFNGEYQIKVLNAKDITINA